MYFRNRNCTFLRFYIWDVVIGLLLVEDLPIGPFWFRRPGNPGRECTQTVLLQPFSFSLKYFSFKDQHVASSTDGSYVFKKLSLWTYNDIQVSSAGVKLYCSSLLSSVFCVILAPRSVSKPVKTTTQAHEDDKTSFPSPTSDHLDQFLLFKPQMRKRKQH